MHLPKRRRQPAGDFVLEVAREAKREMEALRRYPAEVARRIRAGGQVAGQLLPVAGGQGERRESPYHRKGTYS